jgi:hypothetical protein
MLFQPAPFHEWQRNAVAGGDYSARGAYIIGFYRAAEALVFVAIEEHKNDILFFPICFNYRHWLELILKQLIVLAEKLCLVLKEIGDIPDSSEIINWSKTKPKGHNLESLLKSLLTRLSFISKEEFDKNVVDLIVQIYKMDPDGQNFRYPYRTDETLAMEKQNLYDLEHIRVEMENIFNYLSGIEAWLDFNLYQGKDYLKTLHDLYGDLGI